MCSRQCGHHQQLLLQLVTDLFAVEAIFQDAESNKKLQADVIFTSLLLGGDLRHECKNI